MHLTQSAFAFILGSLGHSPTEEKKDQFLKLSKEDRALYEKVTSALLDCFSKRLEHPYWGERRSFPHDCVLIFRQSSSWDGAENMLKEIASTDSAIVQWKGKWLERINQFRTDQNEIQEERQNHETHLLKRGLSPDKVKEIIQEANPLTEKEAVARKHILTSLQTGRQELDQLDPVVKMNLQCQTVVEYLKDKWPCLSVFAEWPEVSVDDERINIKVRWLNKSTTADQPSGLSGLMDISYKAIFIIQQIDQKEKPFEYDGEEPGKFIYPTKINIKDKRLTESSSPYLRKRPSKVHLTDEIFFGCPLAEESPKAQPPKKVSETAKKLEDVVQLALQAVNRKLLQNAEGFKLSDAENEGSDEETAADPHKFNRFWIVPYFLGKPVGNKA